MKHSDEFIENRLKWKARKNGLPKRNSFFIDDLNTYEKQKYAAIFDALEIGKPVLLFKGKKKHWTVFGTKMVVSGAGQSVDSLLYSEIGGHTFGDVPFDLFPEEPKKSFRKLKQDRILVKKKGGGVITLYGPKGGKVYDMYTIILMLERLSNGR